MTIITVAHTKGGAGKSSSAYNIAFEMPADHVVDLDILTGISILAGLRDGSAPPFTIDTFTTTADLLAFLKEKNTDGKTILIDTGGFDSDLTRTAIAAADLVICPCNDTQSELIGMTAFNAVLRDLSERMGDHYTAHLFVCKTHPNKTRFPHLDNELKTKAHIARLKTVIPTRGDHIEPHRQGLGVTELIRTRHSEAGKEITALCDEIKALLQEKTA